MKLTDKDIGKIMRKAREDAIEECARMVDIAVCTKYVDLDIIAAHLRALKDKHG